MASTIVRIRLKSLSSLFFGLEVDTFVGHRTRRGCVNGQKGCFVPRGEQVPTDMASESGARTAHNIAHECLKLSCIPVC